VAEELPPADKGHDACVRTTLTLDDDLADALKRKAAGAGRPFEDVVNEMPRVGLESGLDRRPARRYRVTPAHLGGVSPGVDLDEALRLAASLEDEETIRRLELPK